MKKKMYWGTFAAALLWATLFPFLWSSGEGRCTPVKNTEDAFYVWQRNWNRQVTDAVAREDAASNLYVLFRQIGTKTVRITPDWKALAISRNRIIPVFRILYRDDWLEEDSDEKLKQVLAELDSVRDSFLKSGLKLDELQLDLDCPERLVSHYAAFLASLRNDLDGLKLSITVLPCHLNNPSFSDLVAQVDEYVLQVHGLEYPEKIGDNVSIMDRSLALKAISRAAAYGKHFRAALPTYGYELLFDAGTGNFTGLAAENQVSRRPGLKSTYIVPNLQDVRSVRDTALCTASCSGVVWFRLPVRGDRLCFGRATIKALQDGAIPNTGLSATWHRGLDNDLTELCLHNIGVLGDVHAEISLDWRGNEYCNYGLYSGNTDVSSQSVPGRTPSKICCNIPLPGETTKIAWFGNLESTPEITIGEVKP